MGTLVLSASVFTSSATFMLQSSPSLPFPGVALLTVAFVASEFFSCFSQASLGHEYNCKNSKFESFLKWPCHSICCRVWAPPLFLLYFSYLLKDLGFRSSLERECGAYLPDLMSSICSSLVRGAFSRPCLSIPSLRPTAGYEECLCLTRMWFDTLTKMIQCWLLSKWDSANG